MNIGSGARLPLYAISVWRRWGRGQSSRWDLMSPAAAAAAAVAEMPAASTHRNSSSGSRTRTQGCPSSNRWCTKGGQGRSRAGELLVRRQRPASPCTGWRSQRRHHRQLGITPAALTHSPGSICVVSLARHVPQRYLPQPRVLLAALAPLDVAIPAARGRSRVLSWLLLPRAHRAGGALSGRRAQRGGGQHTTMASSPRTSRS